MSQAKHFHCSKPIESMHSELCEIFFVSSFFLTWIVPSDHSFRLEEIWFYVEIFLLCLIWCPKYSLNVRFLLVVFSVLLSIPISVDYFHEKMLEMYFLHFVWVKNPLNRCHFNKVKKQTHWTHLSSSYIFFFWIQFSGENAKPVDHEVIVKNVVTAHLPPLESINLNMWFVYQC